MAQQPGYSRAEVLMPWLVIPPVTLYLAMGQAAPVDLARFAAELAAALFAGLALSALDSIPRLQRPVWPVVLLAMSYVLPLSSGGSFVLTVYVLSMAAILGFVAVWVTDRVRLPAPLCVAAVVPMLLGLHAVHRTGSETPGGLGWVGDLVADLTWPLNQPQFDPSQPVGPPVILITVDTLRADAVDGMKSVQRLKQGGAYWDSAMSTSSWTLPALGSIQTGVMPGEHGAGCRENFHCQGLRDEVSTVAEDLSGKGYRTAAVNSNPWAGAGNGLQRGFDWFIDLANQEPRRFVFAGLTYNATNHQDGKLVVDLALKQLDAVRGGSFYLWVHALDPHMPYLHSEVPGFDALTVDQIRNPMVLPESYREAVREAYADEVAAVDAELVRLLDELEALGLWEEALIVFTSDHGEEFWEHGGVEHGHSHHGEVVEVPLVIRGPGVQPGRRMGTVSVMDVASTIRAAAGIPTSGVDLRTEGQEPARIVTAQGNLQLWMNCSARNGSERVIVEACQTEAQQLRRYDLIEDPEERWSLPASLGNPVRDAALGVLIPEKRQTTNQNMQALRALGYVD